MANNKFEVDTRTIDGLLSPGAVEFLVPPFQRSYSWGTEEISQFVDDVFGDAAANELPYFLGSIVLAEDNTTDGVSRYLVLDGQQRLTTIALTLAVLMNRLLGLGIDDAKQDERYLYSYIKRKQENKLKLQSSDRIVFESLLTAPFDLSDSKIEKSTLGKSVAEITSALDELAESDNNRSTVENYEAMVERLTLHVEVVQIIAPSEGDAFRLFETLNDRGLALSAADLIKNKIFAQCGKQLETAIEAWTAMLSNVKDDSIVDYLRYYWIAMEGWARKRGLYDAYKSKLERMDETDAGLLAIDLKDTSESYVHIIAPNGDRSPWGREVTRTLSSLLSYRQRSYRPAILSALKFRQNLTEDIAQICESIAVRYSLIGQKNPNELERLYFNLCEIMRSNQKVSDAEFKSLLRERGIFSHIPNDDEFKIQIATVSISKTNQGIRKFLERINEYVGTGEMRVETSDRVHVEHILPQEPTAAVLAESSLSREAASELVSRIGNLTLWSGKRNKEAQNKPFSSKRERYRESEIILTRNLAELDSWSQQEIESRTQEIAEIAVKVFIHPSEILK